MEAYPWARKAVEQAPEVYTFHDTKGWLAYLLGRPEEACKELRYALRGMSESREVHKHLAKAEAAVGNVQLARWHFQAAERLARQIPSSSVGGRAAAAARAENVK